MKSRFIEGANRVIGERQGYLGLAVRDELVDCPVNGPATPEMVTEWEPSGEELERLKAGAPVRLRILGQVHPPVTVEVAEIDELRQRSNVT
jgi:hypothetical protein